VQALSESVASTAHPLARAREFWLALFAFASLLLGVFIYVAERSGNKAYFLRAAYDPHIHSGVLHAVSGQLPSFVHVYAFILLSVAVAPRSMRSGSICLSWAVIDSLFELAQHPAIGRRLLSTLPP